MWRHRGTDIVDLAAICAAAQLIFLFSRILDCVVDCILYNM